MQCTTPDPADHEEVGAAGSAMEHTFLREHSVHRKIIGLHNHDQSDAYFYYIRSNAETRSTAPHSYSLLLKYSCVLLIGTMPTVLDSTARIEKLKKRGATILSHCVKSETEGSKSSDDDNLDHILLKDGFYRIVQASDDDKDLDASIGGQDLQAKDYAVVMSSAEPVLGQFVSGSDFQREKVLMS